MRAEWRSNIWLLLEFLLISLIVWYVSVNLYILFWAYNPSRGYDFNDVYVAYLDGVPPEAPNYIKYSPEETYEANLRDLNNILNQIRQNPCVETAGTGTNALPYNYSFLGNNLKITEGTDTLYYFYNRRVMDSNTIRALRITGSNGESTEQIVAELESGKGIISTFDESFAEINDIDLSLPGRFAGKTAVDGNGNATEVSPVMVNNLRRSDFEPAWNGIFIIPPGANEFPHQIIIRLKPGTDREFMEWVHNARLKAGNLYISDTEPVSQLRENSHQHYQIKLVKMSIIMAFMVILVFLGFLGTYWFRIQERTAEIAIRKAMGATDRRIGARLWGEGYIIMGMATVLFAALAVWFITSDQFEVVFNGIPRVWAYYGIGITAAIMALLEVAGIYFPARRAMKINPATALKDQ